MTAWPVVLRGVTETVVTTRGPNGRWNVAALGVHAPPRSGGAEEGNGGEGPAGRASANTDANGASDGVESRASARTWGRTRTRGNFHREGEGYVQFTPDPVVFVRAACSVHEVDDPILPSADAWARVDVESLEAGVDGGTEWEEWAVTPVESRVVAERPFTANRGYYAVVEATVAASRLDVPGYETDALRERLDYFAGVCETCGGEREREAFALLDDLTGWRE